MERVNGVDKRYARALFRQCDSNVTLAKAKLDSLLPIQELFKVDHARKVLTSPVMPIALKKELLFYALELGKKDESITKFIEVIIEAGRIANLPGLISAFQNLLDEAEGVVKAEVTSAVALEPHQITAISQAIGGGKNVEIEQKLDASILGGIVLRVGNTLVDLSLKTQLNQFAQNAIG
jgi:F-type H+-transporting ATPase subunit delta